MLAMNSRRRTVILLMYGERTAIQSATSMKRWLLTPSARLRGRAKSATSSVVPRGQPTIGYGKQHPKNPGDMFAAENRRVEVVNLEAKGQAQH
jgi:hypothetical protein